MRVTLVEKINDTENGRIGTHTPLGQALLETQEGDEVEYQAGAYIKQVRVLSVS